MRMAEDAAGGAANKCFPAAWGLVPKPCDYCNSATAILFCRTDSTFMCVACDSKIHAPPSRHERVWMCEVCEQAPATVTCKADAAVLCITCDRDIHSANPLARRHERTPVVPFYDTAESVVKTTASTFLVSLHDHNNNHTTNNFSNCGDDTELGTCVSHDDDHKNNQNSCYLTDSWISSSNPTASRVPVDVQEIKSMDFLFSDMDNYLEFDYPISSENNFKQQFYSSGTDGVVPVQTIKPPIPAEAQLPGHHHTSEKHFEIDFTKSHISSYNSYTPQSLSHSVSSSSLDVGVVPDHGSSMSDISYPFGRRQVDPSGNQGSQLMGMDREARVLRYREKRKNRKFEKTIRYASRKAYAETRPRIKGRFAKRNDVKESDVDGMFSPAATSTAAFFPESRFGVVPSV